MREAEAYTVFKIYQSGLFGYVAEGNGIAGLEKARREGCGDENSMKYVAEIFITFYHSYR